MKGAGLVEVEGNYYYIKASGAVYKGSMFVTEAKANGLLPAGMYYFTGENGEMI